MNIIIFDQIDRENLLPLTFTKPVGYLRVGILTLKEKWEQHFKRSVSCLSAEYLRGKYPPVIAEENLLINASVLPDDRITEEITGLKKGTVLVKAGVPIALILNADELYSVDFSDLSEYKQIELNSPVNTISYPWDIFRLNGLEIEKDFKILTAGRRSADLSQTVKAVESEHIFLEPGAKVEFSTLNPNGGYIYLGKDTEIMESCSIRGSFVLGDQSMLKMGAKIYGPTTVGPHSKVGGEVNNSVIQGYSNKGHEGFLGNSVLGEWCNIGADSNNSNLKNNYAEVKLWNYKKKGFVNSGLQFCGLIMGDHSKCGINTMFNTGTVVGVSANIYGSGFPRNFVPSFSWGGASGFTTYKLNKAFETAELVMQRRDIELDEVEKAVLETVFNQTEQYRRK
jgi:UDP-N-acetylglucosamine diphosphorylase/glucosamine-1-phosphate N-acetyltransferase